MSSALGFPTSIMPAASNDQSSSNTLILDIILQMPESQEKEMVSGVSVDLDSNKNLSLNSIVNQLTRFGYPVYNTAVSYFKHSGEMFVLVNRGPVQATDFVPAGAVKDNSLQLRFRNQGMMPQVQQPLPVPQQIPSPTQVPDMGMQPRLPQMSTGYSAQMDQYGGQQMNMNITAPSSTMPPSTPPPMQ